MSERAFKSWQPRELQIEKEGYQPLPEDLREQARQEGFALGYAEGLESGSQESKKIGETLVAELRMLLGAFERPFREVERDVSEYLLSITYAICREILGKDSLIGAEIVVNNLDLSLEILAGVEGLVTVYLNPDDLAVVQNYWADEFGELRIIEDSSLLRGGCRVKRSDSIVDATVEAQLRNLVKELSVTLSQHELSDKPAEALDFDRIESAAYRLQSDPDDD